MNYIILSQFDCRTVLALPASPGGAVRWVDLIEGIPPWTFDTRKGAERARDMNAAGALVAMVIHDEIIVEDEFGLTQVKGKCYKEIVEISPAELCCNVNFAPGDGLADGPFGFEGF